MRLFLSLLALSAVTCIAQSPEAHDPVSAYEDAVHPFEVIKAASQNWSEVERSAYTQAKKRAKDSCEEMRLDPFTGEQLIAYARLCAMGGAWAEVSFAADTFLRGLESEPRPIQADLSHSMELALAWKVQADLRLQRVNDAFTASKTMLREVPYDALVSEAVNSTAGYIKFSEPERAVSLLEARQPTLLEKLRSAANAGSDPTSSPSLSASALYADALLLPSLLRYLDKADAARSRFDEVEASLPAQLASSDLRRVAPLRSSYQLLGKQLPKIDAAVWLMDSEGKATAPKIEATGAATVLFLFPDWCIQCLALRPQLTETWKRLRSDDIRFFTLLMQDDPSTALPARKGGMKSKSLNDKSAFLPLDKNGVPYTSLQLGGDNRPFALLAGTATFVVPTITLRSFFTAETPLVVITDRNGYVRVLQTASDNFLEPGGPLDQMAKHVNEVWP